MDDYKERYRRYLENLLVNAGDDPDARLKAIATLRASHERLLINNPRLAGTDTEALLNAAVEAVIAEYSGPDGPVQAGPTDDAYVPAADERREHAHQSEAPPQPSPSFSAEPAAPAPAPARKTGLLSRHMPVFRAGAGAACAVLAVLAATSLAGVSFGDKARRAALFEEEHQRSAARLPEVVGFLGRIVEEVERMQQDNPDRLVEIAGRRFVGIQRLSRDLSSQQPADLPSGSLFLVRANAEGYKVLFTWPLCRAAAIEMPHMVDPERRNDGLNCSHFGLWNEAGSGL
jgi:hypothetical protein